MRISDWSSDVCSSDLARAKIAFVDSSGETQRRGVGKTLGEIAEREVDRRLRQSDVGAEGFDDSAIERIDLALLAADLERRFAAERIEERVELIVGGAAAKAFGPLEKRELRELRNGLATGEEEVRVGKGGVGKC